VSDCIVCRGREGDAEMGRTEVWGDGVWRLTTALDGPAVGLSYLEPVRHVPHVTDLAGIEAATLGGVLARVTTALRDAAGAEVVYVYVFGDGIAHLHLHLAPHRPGDPWNDTLLRGRLEETRLPSGATALRSLDFPDLPASDHHRFLDRLRRRLAEPG
jgi:diadenosine tetraphosphate (Ap4A) HIT family hydrolase